MARRERTVDDARLPGGFVLSTGDVDRSRQGYVVAAGIRGSVSHWVGADNSSVDRAVGRNSHAAIVTYDDSELCIGGIERNSHRVCAIADYLRCLIVIYRNDLRASARVAMGIAGRPGRSVSHDHWTVASGSYDSTSEIRHQRMAGRVGKGVLIGRAGGDRRRRIVRHSEVGVAGRFIERRIFDVQRHDGYTQTNGRSSS